MIHIQNLTQSYSSQQETITLFHNLDWKVEKGSFVAIMGASGAGKSTLLSLMAGIRSPNSGKIFLEDIDITNLSPDERIEFRGKNIAFIFQAFELLPNLTVTENIDLVLDISHARRRYETVDVLEKVWLSGKGSRFPHELSGGEQQRVAIARAFVADVPFLFADEPTGNLDEWNAGKIMDLIDTFHAETGNTIIMITHDGDIAKRADMIFRLKEWTLTQI